jgi:hypothetical protein
MKPKMDRAKYGAEAFAGATGSLPARFPRRMGPNCMNYLQEVVDSGLSCNMVQRFEQAFAKELGVKHCIATPGCTPALAVLAAAFGFDPGDEIIVSPITDYGTIQGLVREHYIPVFADTESGTINMSAETIEPCITDRTRAILVVHIRCGENHGIGHRRMYRDERRQPDRTNALRRPEPRRRDGTAFWAQAHRARVRVSHAALHGGGMPGATRDHPRSGGSH